jgi:hypothetical protein
MCFPYREAAAGMRWQPRPEHRSAALPEVYRSVGLDPAQAHRVALANPAHHETIRFGREKIVAFPREAGLIGPPATRLWRNAHMIG